jgi:DNA primase
VPAVRQAASVIPIVFAGASEPVVTGETQRGLPACAWPTARRHSVRSSRRLEKPVLVLLDHRNTTSASLARRARRLFVDYLRNGRGTTAVGALFTAAHERAFRSRRR